MWSEGGRKGSGFAPTQAGPSFSGQEFPPLLGGPPDTCHWPLSTGLMLLEPHGKPRTDGTEWRPQLRRRFSSWEMLQRCPEGAHDLTSGKTEAETGGSCPGSPQEGGGRGGGRKHTAEGAVRKAGLVQPLWASVCLPITRGPLGDLPAPTV